MCLKLMNGMGNCADTGPMLHSAVPIMLGLHSLLTSVLSLTVYMVPVLQVIDAAKPMAQNVKILL